MTPFSDSKDWTWVLRRRCPECGFDAAHFPAKFVPRQVRKTIPSWAEVLNRPDVRVRPEEDVWSPLEYACHVRDVYRLFNERLALMLNEEDPLFANWDQNESAVERDYQGQMPQVVADQIAEAGERIAKQFDGLSDDQWKRKGRRSDGAEFTADSFARYLMHDPVHHLWDVGAKVP